MCLSKLNLLTGIAILLSLSPVIAQKPNPPFPGMQSPFKLQSINHTLFYIQRNKNANTVFYDARFTKPGKLDDESPVDVYYIHYASDGKRDELNYLERTLAYGYTFTKDGANHYTIKLRAFPKRTVDLKIPPGSGVPVAYTVINGKRAILTNLYVEAKPSMYTSVVWVDLFGTDPETGKPVKERIYNK